VFWFSKYCPTVAPLTTRRLLLVTVTVTEDEEYPPALALAVTVDMPLLAGTKVVAANDAPLASVMGELEMLPTPAGLLVAVTAMLMETGPATF
jgi:hypothetical protein